MGFVHAPDVVVSARNWHPEWTSLTFCGNQGLLDDGPLERVDPDDLALLDLASFCRGIDLPCLAAPVESTASFRIEC